MTDQKPIKTDGAAAFFDIDYTIVNGSTSTEFIKYLMEKRLRPLLLFKAAMYLGLHKAGIISYQKMSKKSKLPFIRNLDIKEVKRLSKEAFNNRISKLISPKAIEIIESHKKRGHRIVLASATLDFIAGPIADWLEADLISTKVHVKDNRITGRLDSPVCYGRDKAKMVLSYAKTNNIELSRSYGYSDSLSDVPFLKLFGKPYLVNPDKDSEKVAKNKKIGIIDL